MENDVVCGGHHFRSPFARAAHEYITAEVTASERLRPLQRLGSSCNCGEIGWEMGWQDSRVCAGLCQRSRVLPANIALPTFEVSENHPPERQVNQQMGRERGKMRFHMKISFL